MKTLLSGLKIRARIGIALALPLLGLLTTSGILIGEQVQISRDMQRLHDLSILAPDVSALVHELQKERGISAGFIGKKGEGTFAEKLTEQRELTDQQLKHFYEVAEVSHVDSFGTVFEGKFQAALDMVAQLNEQRTAVSGLSLTVGEMAKYYTKTISLLLDTVGEMAVLSSNVEVTNSIVAYINLLQAKERTGIERAMGANGFGKGDFAPAIHQRFVSLIAQQQAFLSNFFAYASPAQKAFYEETVKGPVVDEVAGLRNVARESAYGGSLGGVTGAHWFDAITQKINLLKQVEDRLAGDLQAQVFALEGQALQLFMAAVIGFVVLMIATAGVVFIAVRSVTGPVASITDQMSVLASGDLSVQIDGTDRGDELGEMARAVLVFKDQGKEARRLDEAQKGERERGEREKREALVALAADVESSLDPVVNEVSAASGRLRSTAEGLSEAARQASERAGNASSAVDNAAGNVQTVASASEELSSSIGEISRQVSQSRDISSKAMTEAETAGATVNSLAEAAQKIGDVVNLIQDIAEQTNLLALNATIEAARAGEAGKGFAVVANEVKSLANQTAKATEEIGTQIGDMQSATGNTVSAIEAVRGIIEDIGSTTAAIAAAVEEQDAATREISRNAQEVARGTQEVTSNVSGIAEAASTSGRSADDVLDASEQLSKGSQVLRSKLDEFLQQLRTG